MSMVAPTDVPVREGLGGWLESRLQPVWGPNWLSQDSNSDARKLFNHEIGSVAQVVDHRGELRAGQDGQLQMPQGVLGGLARLGARELGGEELVHPALGTGV